MLPWNRAASPTASGPLLLVFILVFVFVTVVFVVFILVFVIRVFGLDGFQDGEGKRFKSEITS